MIVTRDLLVQLGACQEALDWLDAQVPTLYGLRAIPFGTALFAARKSEWFLWCMAVLQTHRGITAAGAVERFGAIQVATPLGVETVADLATAQATLAQRKAEHLKSIGHVFSVSACVRTPTGDLTITPCDISLATAPAGDYFQAFNHKLGTYMQHPDYPTARAYVLALQSEFVAARAGTYTIQQQIRNPADTAVTAWASL